MLPQGFPPRELALLSLPLVLLLVPFLLWPLAFGLLGSLTNYSPFVKRVEFAGLRNYAFLLHDAFFASSFRTIGIFCLVTVPAELLLGFTLAYLLREPFRGRTVVRIILLFPWLISPVANGVLWHFLYASSTGIFGYFAALLGLTPPPSPLGTRGLVLPAVMMAEVWRATPLVSFLLLPGFLSIPGSLWEQATLEGASPWSVAAKIALPMVKPLLLTITMLLVGWTMGTFDTILILTGGGPGTETLTPALYSYQKAFEANNWAIGATSAWCAAAAVVVMGVLYVIFSGREAQE